MNRITSWNQDSWENINNHRYADDTTNNGRKQRGTKEPLDKGERRELRKNIYLSFTDFIKAFDCVDHNKLWKILKEMGIPDNLPTS